MKMLPVLLLISLFACRCRPTPVAPPLSFSEQEIYQTLRTEPIPLPATTPYDADPEQRRSYLEGFRRSWEGAISGALLNGTFGTPADIPIELRPSWNSGWKRGAALGSERWLKERDARATEKAILLCVLADMVTNADNRVTTIRFVDFSLDCLEELRLRCGPHYSIHHVSTENSPLGSKGADDDTVVLSASIERLTDTRAEVRAAYRSEHSTVVLGYFLRYKREAWRVISVKVIFAT